MEKIIIVLIAVISTLLGATGALCFKKGSTKFRLTIPGIIKNKFFVVGLFLYALATILILFTYKTADLSFVYPLVSLSYVWVAIFSRLFLKEKLNKFKWLGILLIVMGIALINISN